ncbi:MAG: hypothetical protein J3K34DRAFT_429268 [Monoraphidium minutum]|nr:MAG: hypothetical protein J3K34DRAFT_429268 [Monoraphidium minutum]
MMLGSTGAATLPHRLPAQACRPPGMRHGVLAAAGPRPAAAARAARAPAAVAVPPTWPASRRGLRPQRVHSTGDAAEGGAAASGQATAVAEGPLRVELDTAEARRSLRFDVAPMGFGQAIVTVDVAAGSEAEEAGVRAGLRLTAISDPIRRNEVWKLQDRPSLKNIRELLRMRSADTITLEFVPWDGPMPGPARGDSMPTSSAASSTASSVPSPLASIDGGLPGESIGDRLARQYRDTAAAGRSPTAVEQRMAKRRERMELDAERDDRPFLAGIAALFVLPPLIILLVAQSSGYLDSLYMNTLTGMR